MKSIMCAISPLLQICLLVGFVVVLYAIIGLQFLNGAFHYVCVDNGTSAFEDFFCLIYCEKVTLNHTIPNHTIYHTILMILYHTMPCHATRHYSIQYCITISYPEFTTMFDCFQQLWKRNLRSVLHQAKEG